MTFHRAISHEPQAENETANPWVMHLCYLAAAWALIFMLLWRDVWAMASTYWNVSTYNHCLLIVPILVWLVQQRREELARIVPVGWVPGLLWIAAAATGWLIGEAAGVAFARQLAVIMLLQGSVITLLGPNVSRGLAFPLFYAFFLVPFGDEFVPALQSITAKLSMVMLDWSNIPAHIEGVFISTPAGLFEVAEACSGVMFLIAMVAYGALVCNLCFISPWRRAAFMAVSVILPIIANGMRAFGTIYIAEFRGIEFAAGFDHIFYGWIFFAVILVLLMAIGWRFFDRAIDDIPIDAASLQLPVRLTIKPFVALAGIAMLSTMPLLWNSVVAAQASSLPTELRLPQVTGWDSVRYQPQRDWKPRFDGANRILLGSYRNRDSGQTIDLAIAIFDRQEDGREIVGYAQGPFDPESDWSWVADRAAPANGSAMMITAPGPVNREVLAYYRIGNILTGSPAKVKLETLKVRLLGGPQQAVAVLVSAEGGKGSREAVDKFVADLGDIARLADQMAGR